MNVGRDDKRRVHVEYMNTRAAVYTFRSPAILQLAYSGVLLRDRLRGGDRARGGGHWRSTIETAH